MSAPTSGLAILVVHSPARVTSSLLCNHHADVTLPQDEKRVNELLQQKSGLKALLRHRYPWFDVWCVSMLLFMIALCNSPGPLSTRCCLFASCCFLRLEPR